MACVLVQSGWLLQFRFFDELGMQDEEAANRESASSRRRRRVLLHKASRYEAYVIIGRKSVNRTSGCRGLAKVLACGASLAVGKRRWCSGVASVVWCRSVGCVAKTTLATLTTTMLGMAKKSFCMSQK